MLEKLQMYFAYDFVKFALIVGVLVALCAALLGVTLVLKRYSMIGDGLSHMAFGAMTVAMLFSIAPIYLTLPVTILSAVLLLRGGGKLKGDAAVAMLSVSSLAMGYLLLNIFKSGSANLSGDVCSILFGSTSILTLTTSDVVISLVLALVVIAFFVISYHKIFLITFDEEYATAIGLPVEPIKMAMGIIMAVVIVISMNLVGALLITALVVFPVRAAMRLHHSYKSVMVSSSIISVVCVLAGMLVSIVVGTPVGSTVIAVDALAYLAIAAACYVRNA